VSDERPESPFLRSDFDSPEKVDRLGLLDDFWALRPRGQAADEGCVAP